MKAELHCHSIYSDGTLAPAEIMRLAKAKRIGAVALTDHNTISGHAEAEREAKKNGIIFIPGEEISSSDGHILALGINKCVKRGMPAEKTIKIIHRLGGIAVFAHPYGQLFASKGNVEKARFFDAIEVNARSLPMENRKAAQLAKKLGLPLVTGSDSHTKEEFGLFACNVNGRSAGQIINNIRKWNFRLDAMQRSMLGIISAKLKRRLRRLL